MCTITPLLVPQCRYVVWNDTLLLFFLCLIVSEIASLNNISSLSVMWHGGVGYFGEGGVKPAAEPGSVRGPCSTLTLTAASLWELSALSFHYVHDYFSQYSLEQPLIQISPGTEWMIVCVNEAGLLKLLRLFSSGVGGCRLLSNFLLPLSPPVNHSYSELLVGINNQKELERSVIIIIQLIKAYWSGLEAPHSRFTLKAYFLLMWSSTDSMEMWKLGSRILPRMLSSFSSAPIRSVKKKPYVNRLEWDIYQSHDDLH